MESSSLIPLGLLSDSGGKALGVRGYGCGSVLMQQLAHLTLGVPLDWKCGQDQICLS